MSFGGSTIRTIVYGVYIGVSFFGKLPNDSFERCPQIECSGAFVSRLMVAGSNPFACWNELSCWSYAPRDHPTL